MSPVACLVSLLHRWSPRLIFDAIRLQIGRSVPFARLVGIEVEALDGQHARAKLSPNEALRNHVGTLHAGALFTLCESASGAALAGAMSEVIMQARFVVKDARIEYLKPAKGVATARATIVSEASDVLSSLKRNGRADAEVDVSVMLREAGGDELVVARASIFWHLRLPA